MGKRIGIFGGSFNPIHTGHAIISSHILNSGLVDNLWLMVSPQNPLKQGTAMASDYHRLRMTELVTRRIAGATTSAFEFNLPRPSYTIDTLTALKAKFPDDEFYLIIGADNWHLFDKWKDGDKIIENHHIIIYPRMGCEVVVPEQYRERVMVTAAPIVEISSTQVRDMVSRGGAVSFLVPHDVEQYIIKNNLYQPE